VLDTIFVEQSAQLILKRLLLVVFLLRFDVYFRNAPKSDGPTENEP